MPTRLTVSTDKRVSASSARLAHWPMYRLLQVDTPPPRRPRPHARAPLPLGRRSKASPSASGDEVVGGVSTSDPFGRRQQAYHLLVVHLWHRRLLPSTSGISYPALRHPSLESRLTSQIFPQQHSRVVNDERSDSGRSRHFRSFLLSITGSTPPGGVDSPGFGTLLR